MKNLFWKMYRHQFRAMLLAFYLWMFYILWINFANINDEIFKILSEFSMFIKINEVRYLIYKETEKVKGG